ncbi:MAG: substrate-binding domain-containing protein [FCB group bacterium]|jgi:ribose transport system substrate-binding protein|nr:substrate-binding domain-containing protein [FCB group bacterium]
MHKFIVWVAVCAALGAAGCGGPQSASNDANSQTPAAGKKYHIAFSQSNTGEPYRATQNKIFLREIKKYPDCELRIDDAQKSSTNQRNQIESLISQARKPDVLIIAPNEESPVAPAAEAARKAGIKVICLERSLPEGTYDVFVGADNRKIGEMAGQYVAEQLQGKANPVVVEIKGGEGTKPQVMRHEGARQYIDPIPGVNVIEAVAEWEQAEAKKRMETILQSNPKIDAVYAHNDPMAVGAYIAADEAGRKGEMIFVGVDGLGGPAGGIKKVLDGVLNCTFYYPTCAAEALEIAVKIARGEPIPTEPVILEPARITKENAQEWYDKATVE